MSSLLLVLSDAKEIAMIDNLIDVADSVSPQLSTLIERCVNDSVAEQPITLVQVRTFMTDLLPDSFNEAERMHHFGVGESIIDELDSLIEEYGEDALAVDFSKITASEALSQVIEAVVNDDNRENPPTLADVRENMTTGLLSKLVGDGVLEDDEDDSLLAEIESLIARYGADVRAEEFMRNE
jgi:hypothetical protein